MTKKRLMILSLLLGGFMTAFSETLLNTALPAIMTDLHVSQMTAQWLSTGYMLAAAIMMPLSAYFLKTVKLKKLFCSLMLVFLLGDVLAAVAPNFYLLLFGRIIQALCVGISMPLVQSTIAGLFPPQTRGRALGICSIVINLGPAVGPTLSGVLVDRFGWRSLFVVLIPVALLAFLAGLLFVDNITDTRTDQIDWLSVLYSSLGLGSLLYGLSTFGNTASFSWQLLVTVLFGFSLVWLFVRRQGKLVKPLLELKVFRSASFAKAALAVSLNSLALMGPELLMPLYNQKVHGLSAETSGLILLPGALLMALIAPVSGWIYDNYGLKKLAFYGLGLGTLATLPMIFFTPATPIWLLVLVYASRVCAINALWTPIEASALNSLPKKYVVDGSPVLITLMQIANSLGTALLLAIASVVKKNLPSGGEAAGYHWAFVAVLAITALDWLLTMRLNNKSELADSLK
ncbi:MFS transporter [Lactobacillus nasalidis]|uniref:MFS transporter n=1 Tax=Lactobacillus nasalidis TaxID=2797258 RepID=A0ABQ3W5F6_9LACO|nr:MDR family MFS transporter [Lactobacillus nasalidis]GHV97377.1 MFS transporter [Lactobacillus nasalidis]GHW00260.1 MFS transporter [Lactobacillus nasalidis]GHW01691.1 MFS transporter [Lactobacillus nasalidis]